MNNTGRRSLICAHRCSDMRHQGDTIHTTRGRGFAFSFLFHDITRRRLCYSMSMAYGTQGTFQKGKEFRIMITGMRRSIRTGKFSTQILCVYVESAYLL